MRLSSLIAVFCFSAGAHAASLSVDKVMDGFASPESVAVSGADVFVSNVGVKLDPFARDGDGFISRLDRDGNVKALKWVDGLNAPKGLIVMGGVVYVADIDRVLGFSMADGKRVFDLDLAATGAKFLNAFARHDAHRLLLSSTDLGKVFVIDVKSRQVSELAFDTPPKGPNGIKRAGRKLMVVEWGSDNQPNGEIKTYRLAGMKATLAKTFTPKPAGYFDGVADLGGGRWLVSNWVKFEPAGQLLWLDTQSGKTEVLNAAMPIAGPADLTLDDQRMVWVPGMIEGKVYRLRLQP